MRILALFIFLITTAEASDLPNIKNIVIHKVPKTYENVFFSIENAIKIFDFCEIELSNHELVQVKNFITQSRNYNVKRSDSVDPSEKAIRKSVSYFLDRKTHERFCAITGNYRDYTV